MRARTTTTTCTEATDCKQAARKSTKTNYYRLFAIDLNADHPHDSGDVPVRNRLHPWIVAVTRRPRKTSGTDAALCSFVS
jgi:hypothetical protein